MSSLLFFFCCHHYHHLHLGELKSWPLQNLKDHPLINLKDYKNIYFIPRIILAWENLNENDSSYFYYDFFYKDIFYFLLISRFNLVNLKLSQIFISSNHTNTYLR